MVFAHLPDVAPSALIMGSMVKIMPGTEFQRAGRSVVQHLRFSCADAILQELAHDQKPGFLGRVSVIAFSQRAADAASSSAGEAGAAAWRDHSTGGDMAGSSDRPPITSMWRVAELFMGGRPGSVADLTVGRGAGSSAGGAGGVGLMVGMPRYDN